MKFTVISHACLYVEHENIKLLIDPWLVGSCYWRSWWNYPEVENHLLDKIKPTHIYITHLHWDHFHGPSLRKFHKDNPQILLPKHFNKRMKKDFLRDFKFSNVSELDHGKKKLLGKDFSVTSYQFNPFIIDSSLVIESNNITLLDVNDSKTFGLSMRQILKNHQNIDFAFRSHSSATAIPHCIRGANVEKSDRSPSDYANDFISFAKSTRSKYIIPFASSHIYLHPMSKKYNKFYSNPSYVKNQFDKQIETNQKCILMPSNSSWSEKKGFEINHCDFLKIDKDIANYSEKNKLKINQQEKLELKQKLNKSSFYKYYDKFLKSLPKILRPLKFRFGFYIDEKSTNSIFLCIVDGINSNTQILEIKKENDIFAQNLKFVIKTPIYVFNDCNTKIMHNTFAASKLLEIIITSKTGKKDLSKYFNLIDLYENDCLPILGLFSLRNLIILFRRWRELFDMIYFLYLIKIKKGKINELYS